MIVEQRAGGHVYALAYHDGRIADVSVDGLVVDALEVGEWDWSRHAPARAVPERELAHELARWIEQHAVEYAPRGAHEFLPSTRSGPRRRQTPGPAWTSRSQSR